jgi:hypothetical protein
MRHVNVMRQANCFVSCQHTSAMRILLILLAHGMGEEYSMHRLFVSVKGAVFMHPRGVVRGVCQGQLCSSTPVI